MLVVVGLAFMGLLPWPDRLVGAGLLQGARSRGSRVLLGAAFAVCAAPCIGPVLAGILVLAGSTETVLEGAVLLGVYSLGLAVPFVLAGALFTRSMAAFRWLRDHYRGIQVAGRYEDRLVREDGVWKFKSRQAFNDVTAPAPAAAPSSNSR